MMDIFTNKLTKYVINNSNEDLWVLDISGKHYRLPGTPFTFNTPYGPFLKYTAECDGKEDTRLYPYPTTKAPTFISEIDSMFYSSQEDLERDIARFGTGQNVIRSYVSGEVGLYFGCGRMIINMSGNKYYIVDQDEVIEIPQCDEAFKKQYLAAAGLTHRDASEKDLFVIYTHVAPANLATGELNVRKYVNRWVTKFSKNESHPIFLDDQNLIIFNNKYAAEEFITRFEGKLAKYFSYLADEATKEKHLQDIKEIQLETRNDKISIAKTASLIAASGVVGAVIKWILDKVFTSNPLIAVPYYAANAAFASLGLISQAPKLSDILLSERMVEKFGFLKIIKYIACALGNIKETILNFAPIKFIRNTLSGIGNFVKEGLCSIGHGIKNFFTNLFGGPNLAYT
jgi:hypothetical protein